VSVVKHILEPSAGYDFFMHQESPNMRHCSLEALKVAKRVAMCLISVVDDSATSQLNTSSTLLIEQLSESTLVLLALSFDFSTIAYWLATSLLSITAFAHRIDFLAYF
jgi:hypothetical protein